MPSLKNYYLDNKRWFEIALKLFVVALVAGGVTFFLRPDILSQIVDVFSGKFGPEPARDVNLALQIFYNNAIACSIALIGGLLFGISSFIIVFVNGFIIGFIILALMAVPGNPLRNLEYIVLGLVPHGIFEIPAFLIASSLGMRLGVDYLLKENKGQRKHVFWSDLKRVIYNIPVLAVMLFIAAFVEVFVSGNFIAHF